MDMDRVVTLSERLQEQLKQGASADVLLLTVQMIQAELMHLNPGIELNKVIPNIGIDIPVVLPPENYNEKNNLPVVQEKMVHVLKIDEAEIEAELEQIKKSAEAKISSSVKNKPTLEFDPIEDTPTLIHQNTTTNDNKSNPKSSLADTLSTRNDQLRKDNKEIGDSLSDAPIKDLRKAIGVNDRFLFINELFLGDEVMYERSIKTINAFTIYPEAEYWIRRELKLKLAWNENSEMVKQFNQLVKRRFNFI